MSTFYRVNTQLTDGSQSSAPFDTLKQAKMYARSLHTSPTVLIDTVEVLKYTVQRMPWRETKSKKK